MDAGKQVTQEPKPLAHPYYKQAERPAFFMLSQSSGLILNTQFESYN
jgi:hypothetical protein